MGLIDADALMEIYADRMSAVAERYSIDSSECGILAGAMKLLEKQPTIEQPQWIPVSERLPEELAEVNITWINTNPEPYYDFIKDKPATGSAVYYKGRWYWYSAVCTDYLREYGCSPYDEMDDAIKVLAWMPLPKAYEVTE